jgi:DNA polymerase-3 subunit epsilon
MEDATEERAARDRRDQLFRSITQDTRRSVAGIRAAIEMIRDYPAMSNEERGKFRSVIADEAERLSARVDEVSSDHTDTLESAWELEDMLADDLILALANRIEDAAAIATSTDVQAESIWVKVDALALVDRLGAIVEQIVDQAGATELVFGLQESGRFAVLDLSWPESEVTELAISASIRGAPNSGDDLQSVIDRHGGEVWCEVGPDGRPFLRVLLPKSTAVPALAVRVLDEGRPEYHDFDLFERRDPAGALEDRPLREFSTGGCFALRHSINSSILAVRFRPIRTPFTRSRRRCWWDSTRSMSSCPGSRGLSATRCWSGIMLPST